MCNIKKVQKKIFILFNSPDPPDHLPILEASEILVKLFQIHFFIVKDLQIATVVVLNVLYHS